MSGVYSIAEVIDDSNKRPEKTIFSYIKEEGVLKLYESQIKSLENVARMVESNGGKYVEFDKLADYLNSKCDEKYQIKQIIINRCSDGVLWVNSNFDPNGCEYNFKDTLDGRKQLMIALANYLGYEPGHILDFDGVLEYDLENGGILNFEDDE